MYHCKNTGNDKYNDDKSTRSTSIRASVKKLAKNIKKISRFFTTVNTQLQKLKESDSDPYESEDEMKHHIFIWSRLFWYK